MKTYSLEYNQFAGTSALSENFAEYQQYFMNNCKTLHLSESEALNNLQITIKPTAKREYFNIHRSSILNNL